MNKRWVAALAGLICMLVLSACSRGQVMDGEDMVRKTYTPISQEKAREMMEEEENCIIVDVRRQDEFETGHIPGAVCIPNETIEEEAPAELPDPDQIILIYCRSGKPQQAGSGKAGLSGLYECI